MGTVSLSTSGSLSVSVTTVEVTLPPSVTIEGGSVPDARLLPTPLGTAGQVPTVASGGATVQWATPSAGGGADLSDADPEDVGTSPSAGTSTEAARADHVHDVVTNTANGLLRLDDDGTVPDNRIPSSIARDSEVTAAVAGLLEAPDGATEDQIPVFADTSGAIRDSGTAIGDLATKAEVAAISTQPIGTIVTLPVTASRSSDSVGTFSFAASSTYMHGGVLFTTGLNNIAAWDIYLEAGTWTAELMYGKTTGGGIITPSLDGVTADTIDTYNGSTSANQVASSTFVVTTAGVKSLRYKVTGRNASNTTAYDMRLQHIVLRRVTPALSGGGGGLAAPETAVSGAGQDMYLYRSPLHSAVSGAATLVIYCHGANGLPSHAGTNSTHNKVTQAMLDEGWMVAASEQHGNSWGNATSVSDLVDLVAWVKATYDVANIVMWGASMGGLSALNALKAGSLSGETIIGMVGSSPVCSVLDMHDNSGWTSSIRAAYGSDDRAELVTDSAGYDPVREPASTWAGKNIRVYASPDDLSVDRDENAVAFIAIADDTATSAVLVDTTGSHGDASNYPPSAIVAWVNTIGGT